MPKNNLVTLTTDYGTSDPYVGAMKGALLRHCPKAQIVDISHDVPPHDILAGAFVLAHAAPAFPEGTLHVAVVDPTVGTQRPVLAAQMGGQFFLLPDNGVITLLIEVLPLQGLYAVRNTQYLPALASMTFHGRDVFAPLAAHILNGLDISRLGPQPSSYALLNLPGPVLGAAAVAGQVLYIDRFGNLVTNITRAMLAQLGDLDSLAVRLAGREIGPLAGTYAFVPAGEALALVNSMDLLEIAVNMGRARDALQAGVGAEVTVTTRGAV